ncbi:MAG: hypothetical protein JXQ72_16815, partial [Anaerolineae bacterium]|nr:hypothetical protein [Anaerolineae bacterium]
EYREGIFQVRIDPRHLNNTDPADFGLEGEWLANAEVRAFVFETADGWGVEAAVAWSPYDYVPHNGAVIGFNTSLNGATQPDGGRDVKLIWSLWDTADRAWLDPSVLGIGVFKDDFR